MSEEITAVVVKEKKSLFQMEPAEMVRGVSQMAGVLKDIIEKQNLYNLIGGKKHVRVEGWQIIGTMMGIVPKEVSVSELPDGSYVAEVQLVNMSNGMIVGGASSLCSMDEKRWGSAEKYARRSMAVTRATGKAYRLGFSWVMSMAGYEVTPLEEMPHNENLTKQATPLPNTSEIYTGTVEQKARLIKYCKANKITDVGSQSAIEAALMGRPIKDIKEITETL